MNLSHVRGGYTSAAAGLVTVEFIVQVADYLRDEPGIADLAHRLGSLLGLVDATGDGNTSGLRGISSRARACDAGGAQKVRAMPRQL